MSQRITIQIKDKIATCLTEVPVVCGNSDYVVDFLFDEEWDEHNLKTARFQVNGEYTEVVFEGNTCEMPIIFGAKMVMVGVVAGDLSTSTPAIVYCTPSILCGSGTPSVAQKEGYRLLVELIEGLSIANGGADDSIVQTAPEGSENIASGKGAGAFGANSKALADFAFALGSWAAARKQGAFAANAGDAKEIFSAAFNTGYANADRSFAKGHKTNANAYASETGGIETTVEEAAIAGVADGKKSVAGAPYSAAHNLECKTGAGANSAYAGGEYSEANHKGAFVHGFKLFTGRDFQAVFGKNNEIDENALFIVACGKDGAPLNIFTVAPNGSVLKTDLSIGGKLSTKGNITTDGIMKAESLSAHGAILGRGNVDIGTDWTTIYKGTSFKAKAFLDAGATASELTIPNGAYLGKGIIFSTIGEDGTNNAGGVRTNTLYLRNKANQDATLTYDDMVALKGKLSEPKQIVFTLDLTASGGKNRSFSVTEGTTWSSFIADMKNSGTISLDLTIDENSWNVRFGGKDVMKSPVKSVNSLEEIITNGYYYTKSQ